MRMERVGETFLQGYHLALADQGIESLAERLSEIDLEFRGYGFEGAAMALDILDQLHPWNRRRIIGLLRGPGNPHVYMVHVGVGWSMARCRFGIQRRLARLDPLLRWLSLDGFGFHEGYFHWPRYADGILPRLTTLRGYSLRAFDQGLGRSLWFVGGADTDYIVSAIGRFPEARRDDLWSGIGLACAYTGGADRESVLALRYASGPHWPHLAQGAVFAAGARHRAGNMAPQTEQGCRALGGVSALQAASLCEETLRNLADDAEPAYEIWRRRIRTQLQVEEEIERNFPETVNKNASSSIQIETAQPRVQVAHPRFALANPEGSRQ